MGGSSSGAQGIFDPDIRAEVEAAAATGRKGGGGLAGVIPVGSTEQHGPHLPVSTDSDIVTEVARRVATDNGFVLLPTLSYGVSFEHAPYFNLSLSESTLQAVLADLCRSLLANGMGTILIINGHHGNREAMRGLRARLRRGQMPDGGDDDDDNDDRGGDHGGSGSGSNSSGNSISNGSVFMFDYWDYMGREFDHAGFVETSLMLAVSDSVRMERAERGLVTDGMGQDEVRRLAQMAQESFPKATGNGVWGDPTGATRKDGCEILEEIVRNLGAACRDSAA